VKLIVAVVQDIDGERVQSALVDRGFEATRIDSSGGFLRQGNVTILVGVQDWYVSEAIKTIREHCMSRTQYVNPLMPILEPGEYHVSSPVEVAVGGATLFVLRVSRYERMS
jgi:uncharacterized protein YaaQ